MTVEDLAKGEIKYRSIFENSGVGMLYVDENMTITLANKEFERITGYSREQVEGIMRWTVLIPDKGDLERMKTYHRLRRIDPALAPESYNTSICTRSGAVRDVNLHVIMIPGMTDSLVAFTDITEQHLAENELVTANRKLHETIARLEESEERLRGITANLPGVVYQLYTMDNGEYGISYASDRVTEVFGIPAGPDNTFRGSDMV
jgi:PAS domain S-box-containing protein